MGYNLTLTRKKDDAVFNKAATLADVRNKIDYFQGYLPDYGPTIPQKGTLSKQILNKTPIEFKNKETSVK